MLRHEGMLARDFMGKGVVTVLKDSNVKKAIRAMNEHNIGSVVALDSLGPCGVFTERDLINRVLGRGKDPGSTVISEVLSPRFPSVEAATTLEETAKAMIRMKSRLMVFEGTDLVGVVTPTDLVRALQRVERNFDLESEITRDVVTVHPHAPVDVVIKIMSEKRIGSVLVSEDDLWTGIFTERDLIRRILAPGRRLDTAVAGVASAPVITSEVGILGVEAAGTMAIHKIKRLPLTSDGRPSFIVTARDVVEAYVASLNRTRAPLVDWVQWN
jgi:CBS domain-containing protein